MRPAYSIEGNEEQTGNESERESGGKSIKGINARDESSWFDGGWNG